MRKPSSSAPSKSAPPTRIAMLSRAPLLLLLLFPLVTFAQMTSETTDSSSCVLKNHIYTCDLAAFQKDLADAKTVTIETHSVDKLAEAQLNTMLTKKLGKSLLPDGSPADLIFLLIPLGIEGWDMSPGDVDIGTLRVYSATRQGARQHLLWAETFKGSEDLPWPIVVHSLIAQFQSRFHIK